MVELGFVYYVQQYYYQYEGDYDDCYLYGGDVQVVQVDVVFRDGVLGEVFVFGIEDVL